MFRRLKDIETRYKDLEGLLSSPDVVSKHSVYQKYAKEHADLYDLV
jgi:peptide chain release factor 1